MTFSTINVDISDHIATLTLNHPDSQNSLSEATLGEMIEALEWLCTQDDAWALILTGAGQAFCSGADLGKMDAVDVDGRSLGERAAVTMDALANPLILALQQFPLPVVAAVNGVAAGGGMALALAADIVIATRSAYFLTPFLPRLGIVPDMGASWFLPQRIGRARSLGLLLLGDRLSAEKAREWGLIWACVEDDVLLDEARRIAGRLAQAPPRSALEARRALDAADSQDLVAQLGYERDRQRELLDAPAFKEGVKAFFEKRAPVFER
ncbi:enoyl-CoA hydratase-related protein [Pseudomonas saliphila]|uniref:enoyl-CoA hydratase-related protein n=1 Tax=Pseudomonas saliphila TaxID=2586906 RepID=UPI001239FCA7|nr:enoyl-CoA hydratase-related protein [Pseudomonas saliphila]